MMIAQLPNAITLTRLLLVVPIGYCMLQEYWYTVLILLVLAGLTDWFDGLLARKFGWETRFGQIVDPIADKLTFGTVVVLLTLHGSIPLWLTIVVFAREFVILLGAVLYRLLFKTLEVQPLFVSKLNTVLQVVLLALIVLSLANESAGQALQSIVDPIGFWVVAVSALISGAAYVFVWSKKASEHGNSSPYSSNTDGIP